MYVVCRMQNRKLIDSDSDDTMRHTVVSYFVRTIVQRRFFAYPIGFRSEETLTGFPIATVVRISPPRFNATIVAILLGFAGHGDELFVAHCYDPRRIMNDIIRWIQSDGHGVVNIEKRRIRLLLLGVCCGCGEQC